MRWQWAILLFTTMAMAEAGDKALVFGGTGRLGAPIAQLLVEAGYDVTVFARPTSDRGRLAGYDVDFILGDLLDADSVTAAVDGKSYAYVVDASARGSSGDPFYATAMRNILAALDRDDVRQLILHGSVGAGDNIDNFPDVPFGRMKIALEAKGEAEEMLKGSGIPYTIIRNGLIERDGTPPTGTARLTEDQAVLGKTTRLDLAALTLTCLDDPDCLNKTFHVVDDSL